MIDKNEKGIISDFCFTTKEDAVKLGEKLKEQYCYNNETMRDLYICVNGNAENFGSFTDLLCEDDCPGGEEEFIYPEAYDEPFDEIDREDISHKIEEIQSSIKELQNLIKRSYDDKFKDSKQIICDASIADADNAHESLEQVKALCDVLSDAYDDTIRTST